MNTKKKYATVEENPLYHDTWALLKNYRDAVWNLELAVQQVRNTFACRQEKKEASGRGGEEPSPGVPPADTQVL